MLMKLFRKLFPAKVRLRIMLKSGSHVDVSVKEYEFETNGSIITGWKLTWAGYERIITLPPGNIECVVRIK